MKKLLLSAGIYVIAIIINNNFIITFEYSSSVSLILLLVSIYYSIIGIREYGKAWKQIKRTILLITIPILLFFTYFTISTFLSYGKYKDNLQEQKTSDDFNNWLNGWMNECFEVRKSYSSKINSITIVEIKSNADYSDANKMRAYKNCLEQVLDAELWKIDKIIEADNIWSKKFDPIFGVKFPEQSKYLLEQFDKGKNEGNKFRQITINYINDQVAFVNFLLEKNCTLVKSDEAIYNNFSSKIQNSTMIYNKAVSDIYNINLKRVKEFNLHFKNANLDKLVDIIPDGIINGK